MEKRTLIIIFVTLLLFAVGGWGAYLVMREENQEDKEAKSLANSEANTEREEGLTTVIGGLRLAGNEPFGSRRVRGSPFTFLVLETPEGEENYVICGKYERELRELQNKIVQVQGYIRQSDVGKRLDIQSYEVLSPPGGIIRTYLKLFKNKTGKRVEEKVFEITFKGRSGYLVNGEIAVPTSLIAELWDCIDNLYRQWVRVSEPVVGTPFDCYATIQIDRFFGGSEQIFLYLLPRSRNRDDLSSDWLMHRWKTSGIVFSPKLTGALENLLTFLDFSSENIAIGPCFLEKGTHQ